MAPKRIPTRGVDKDRYRSYLKKAEESNSRREVR